MGSPIPTMTIGTVCGRLLGGQRRRRAESDDHIDLERPVRPRAGEPLVLPVASGIR